MSQPTVIQNATPVLAAGGTTKAISLAALPTPGNALVLTVSTRGAPITGVADNQGNAFTQAAVSASSSGTGNVAVWWLPNVPATSGTYTVTATGAATVAGWELGLIEATNLSFIIDQSATLNDSAGPVAAAAIAAPTDLSSNDLWVAALCLAGTYPSANPSFSGPHSTYTQIFSSNPNTTGQLVSSAAYQITSFVVAATASWTWTNADGFAAVIVSFRGSPSGDGTTASGTSVTTGTGGVALPVVVIGNVIDVLFMAQSGSPNGCTCSDGIGNVYTQIDHLDRTASSSREFYRFMAIAASSGTPAVKCTYGATSALAVAATVLTGISTPPFVTGQVANHFQSAASIGGGSTDLQSSGNTPPLLVQPVILAAWGYCDGKNAAPLAGTGFQDAGPNLWGALGVACLNYETLTYASTSPAAAKFTPVANQDAYTFAAAFDLVRIPITPAGPMPKQIYILP